jgi:hypothetical protein
MNMLTAQQVIDKANMLGQTVVYVTTSFHSNGHIAEFVIFDTEQKAMDYMHKKRKALPNWKGAIAVEPGP